MSTNYSNDGMLVGVHAACLGAKVHQGYHLIGDTDETKLKSVQL